MGQASVPLTHRGLQALMLESLEVLKGYLWSRAVSCCENRVCVCQCLLKKKKETQSMRQKLKIRRFHITLGF